MSYAVVWRPIAELHLAELWVGKPYRQSITNAANLIDSQRSSAPHKHGHLRTHETRVLIVAPLAVLFEIKEPDRVVAVLDVWDIAFITNGWG